MTLSLVTGGTGAIGNHIVHQLVAEQRSVRVLVRSIERARRAVPEGVELVLGDVTDGESVRRAMEGCATVFHAAGVPEQWVDDETVFERVNASGTRNVVEAALEQKISRFVYTSTIDVFAARPGESFDETQIDTAPKPTEYQRSKQTADRIVAAAVEQGLAAVFVHPAAVYGPAIGASSGVNDFVARLLRRELPMLLPGMLPLVFARDAARGHVLAERLGAPGARYILCETTVRLDELADLVAREFGLARIPPVAPMSIVRLVSAVGTQIARVRHRAPMIPAGQLAFLAACGRPVSARASTELGWQPIPLAEGLRATVQFLRDAGTV